MVPFRRQNKFGPGLDMRMRAPASAGGDESLRVVVLCTDRGLKTLRRHHDLAVSSEALPFAVVSAVTRSEILRLAQDRGIRLLEIDERYASVPDPVAGTGLRNADVFSRYKHGPLRDLNGSGVRVLIQDTGYSTHPDIPNRIRSIDCTSDGTTRDYHGHGTAIVSQMAARGKFPGLIPEAEIMMARIFDRSQSTSLSAILRACSAALEHSAHVVSMSYGGPMPNPAIALAMRRLHASGVCLIAAAGNSGPANGTIEYPGGYAEVLATAAVTKDGRLAPFSSRGRPRQNPMKPDVALEGVNIVMAKSPDGNMGTPAEPGYIMASGTSFACPIGACLAAMVIEARGTRTAPNDVYEILRRSARRA